MFRLNKSYNPGFLFKNPHFNTIYPFIFRPKLKLPFVRERIDTIDGDFLDLDWIQTGYESLVILCHGLEGSSESKYIRHMAALCSELGYDVLAINYRSCSGEINLTKRIYNSGDTSDIAFVIENQCKAYKSIHLIGYSLGGNLVLKYTGQYPDKVASNIDSVSAISVPCDLEGSSAVMKEARNIIYTRKFLKTLKAKAKVKYKQFPQSFDLDAVMSSKTVFEFDDVFTGPIHGFKDALDYYRQSSSLQFLGGIKVPCLIVNAFDDSFLSESCHPFEAAKNNPFLQLIVSRYGGHVGFVQWRSTEYWHEVQIIKFLSEIKKNKGVLDTKQN